MRFVIFYGGLIIFLCQYGLFEWSGFHAKQGAGRELYQLGAEFCGAQVTNLKNVVMVIHRAYGDDFFCKIYANCRNIHDDFSFAI